MADVYSVRAMPNPGDPVSFFHVGAKDSTMLIRRSLIWATVVLVAAAGAFGATEQRLRAIKPTVDEKARRVMIPGRVAKQNVYEQLKGAIEYVAVCPGGKEYESLFICPVEPLELREAFLRIGLKAGQPAQEVDGQTLAPRGGLFRIGVEWMEGADKRRADVTHFVLDAAAASGAMPETAWAFTGSRQVYDPESGKTVLEATLVRNLISLHQLDPGVLAQNPTPGASDGNRYKTNLKALPPEGTAITLVIEAVEAKRIHLMVSGQVQGVGFREFARRTALGLGIRGWARNLRDGAVELLAEGTPDSLEQFKQKISKGPRGAKVDAVREVASAPSEAVGEFEVRPTPEQ
jgi:acylphosphatase